MGNDIGCTPVLAVATPCTPSLSTMPGSSHGGKTDEWTIDPCTPCVAAAGRRLDPLSDQECADIALVQATVRGEISDVIRALSLGASPNTIADLRLRMGEPNKKGRKGPAAHLTPLMRASDLGHEDVAQQLLKAKASLLQCDSHGWTPLCHALAAGEVSIARLVVQQPGFKMIKQRDICEKLLPEILAKCRSEVGDEEAAAIERELGPGGLLDRGFEVSSNWNGSAPGLPPAASAEAILPLYSEEQDLLSGEYPYAYSPANTA